MIKDIEQVIEYKYHCTLYDRECISDLCSVTPNSVRCAHREQVKDES